MKKKAILALLAGAMSDDLDGPDEDRRRMDFLVAEIERHSELYYGQDSQEISDDQFGELFRELKELEVRRPDLARPGGGKH
jgi:NAD-dependent DNA ligase